MKCFDTYPLIEIANGNPKFEMFLKEDFVVTDVTMAEFYYVLLQKYGTETAEFWYGKLEHYCVIVPRSILIEAVKFRHSEKKMNLSFFDCVGYIFAISNNLQFLTGDKEFQNLKNVLYIA